MKRFYKLVSTQKQQGGFGIALDGKPVKTPAGALLKTSSENLAEAIAAEWAAQGEKIDPESMPLTQILSTCIDRSARDRASITEALLKYLNTDLLCYRTGHPPELAQKQEAAWNPPLSWFEKRFGTGLQCTSDLKALTQPAAAYEKVASYIDALDSEHFTVLQLVTSLSGSLVLGIAFTENAIGPDEVFHAAHVEEGHKAEIYNEELYGPDPHQHKKQTAARRDLEAAAKFLSYFK